MGEEVLVYRFAELESCSGRMGNVVSALDHLKDISVKAKAEIGEYWSGNAYESFLSRMDKMTDALRELHDDVERSRQKLDQAIALARENEKGIQNKVVGELSADNIF